MQQERRRFFAAVLAPEGLAAAIHEYRLWIGSRYGCSSGFRTPPHVTLIPPFELAGTEDLPDLELALAEFARGQPPFLARVEGFGAFGDRTVFASPVEQPEWGALHRNLYRHIGHDFPGLIRPDKRPFHPHVTIANRDIPSGASLEILAHLRAAGINVDYPVDHLALMEYESWAWTERSCWPLEA
jgi:2'-5' RNA ligase